jgi:hypothetical protein
MYSTLYSAVSDAAASEINNALDDFANKFAPVPPEPDNTWLLVLLDIVTIGASAALGPFFNNCMFCQSNWRFPGLENHGVFTNNGAI